MQIREFIRWRAVPAQSPAHNTIDRARHINRTRSNRVVLSWCIAAPFWLGSQHRHNRKQPPEPPAAAASYRCSNSYFAADSSLGCGFGFIALGSGM